MGKGERDKSVRERIAQQRELERKQAVRKKIATYVTVGVVAVAAVGAGVWFGQSKTQSEAAGANLAPITVQGDGTVVMAKEGVTSPVVDIFEDFQCPACKQLEEISGSTFKNLAAEGKAKVVFHPITIFPQDFNKGITRGNSVRAAAAAMCVTDGPQWLAYHDKLFKQQPDETVEGFKVDDLVGWGKDVGVTADGFDSCVSTQKHAATVTAFSDKTIQAQKIEGTPTVKLNGTAIDNQVLFSPEELRKTVDAAN